VWWSAHRTAITVDYNPRRFQINRFAEIVFKARGGDLGFSAVVGDGIRRS
jgi:hypothetical protein